MMVYSWRRHINLLKRCNEFKSFETLQTFCRDSEPRTKKVLALLKANPTSDPERECLEYIYIKYIN